MQIRPRIAAAQPAPQAGGLAAAPAPAIAQPAAHADPAQALMIELLAQAHALQRPVQRGPNVLEKLIDKVFAMPPPYLIGLLILFMVSNSPSMGA